ncbi:MAG TPA: hypothetical protein VJM11_01430 [Nevskiaceae bacterium]|nr:hypothetical protein [Nevskiaceae bacterium]
MRVQTACVAAVSALLIAGCNGVGDGSKPEKIEISKIVGSSVVLDDEPAQAYTCLTTRLGLVVTFTDGDRGDFSSRARWTSENEDVAVVSNYNEPISDKIEGEEGSVYTAGGVIYPIGLGATTIHVEYVGFTASLGVEVSPVTGLRILPDAAKIVPKSNQVYTVRARLDGVETDVTSLATIELLDEDGEVPSEDIALFSTSSGANVVTGVGAQADGDAPLTVKTTFEAPCTTAPTTTVRVENMAPGGLKLGYEEGYESAQLAEDTSEFLTLTATFADGSTQDLSAQSRVRFDYDRDGDGLCEVTKESLGTNDSNTVAACDDDEDNDGDGKTDLDDPGCASATDDDELDAPPIAFSGLLTGLNLLFANNDDDHRDAQTLMCAVFGADAVADSDDPELAACEDGVDNDEDGDIDLADADCADADDDNEADEGIQSDTIPLRVVDRPLKAFTVTAVDPCEPEETGCTPLEPIDQDNLTVKAGQIIRFLADGQFARTGSPDAPVYEQDITKDVVWVLSVDDEDADFAPAVVVSGRSLAAGTVSTLKRFTGVDGCEDQPTCRIHVTATYTRGDSDEDNDVSVEKILTVTDPEPDEDEEDDR